MIMGIRFPPYTVRYSILHMSILTLRSLQDAKLKAINSTVLPTIPYPRPGHSAPFQWQRYVTLAVVFIAVAMNKQRIINMIKS
jgi:hypothetical protein